MKARDLIPGWPKPRSTVCSTPYDCSAMLRFGRCSWSSLDLERLCEDVVLNNNYHRAQQLMLDDFHSQYRRKTAQELRYFRFFSGEIVILDEADL
jgi:hypothetical protein